MTSDQTEAQACKSGCKFEASLLNRFGEMCDLTTCV